MVVFICQPDVQIICFRVLLYIINHCISETVDGFRDGESGVIVEPQAALTAV